MVMSPLSGLFLALTCIAAIAGVGSVFELASGTPQLGVNVTRLILGLSVPAVGFGFFAAVRSAREQE